MSIKSDPNLRGFADAIIGLEDTLNYVLEIAYQQGIKMKLQAEVVDMAHSPSRLHFRILTPDMEVTDDLPSKPREVAVSPVEGQATG